MKRLRTRLALRLAPWLKPAPFQQIYTSSGNPDVKVTWTDPPTVGPTHFAR